VSQSTRLLSDLGALITAYATENVCFDAYATGNAMNYFVVRSCMAIAELYQILHALTIAGCILWLYFIIAYSVVSFKYWLNYFCF
jgi:hypothetical protein